MCVINCFASLSTTLSLSLPLISRRRWLTASERLRPSSRDRWRHVDVTCSCLTRRHRSGSPVIVTVRLSVRPSVCRLRGLWISVVGRQTDRWQMERQSVLRYGLLAAMATACTRQCCGDVTNKCAARHDVITWLTAAQPEALISSCPDARLSSIVNRWDFD